MITIWVSDHYKFTVDVSLLEPMLDWISKNYSGEIRIEKA